MPPTTQNKNPLGREPGDPAVTPPPAGSETTFAKKPKLGSTKSKKREIPEGLWTKCPKCSTMIFDKELDANLKVCGKCGHHFPIGAGERINGLVETCSFEEMDAELTSVDALKFTAVSAYADKLQEYQKKTKLNDAVITGIGRIDGFRVGLGVMDFDFLGGSMGSAVGVKPPRLIEAAPAKALPLLIISTSGRPRRFQGIVSL